MWGFLLSWMPAGIAVRIASEVANSAAAEILHGGLGPNQFAESTGQEGGSAFWLTEAYLGFRSGKILRSMSPLGNTRLDRGWNSSG
jgi:hypothetical protein